MYTVTIKIAARDTEYITYNNDGSIKSSKPSFAGHMWYSLSKDGVSAGLPRSHFLFDTISLKTMINR